MIGYLRGKVLERTEGRWLMAIENAESAIGYAVCVPESAEYTETSTTQSTELFIHTHVREDALELYGFHTRLEKDFFLTLLSVNGIGPKGALKILSSAQPARLIQTILDGDKEALCQIPGIGKKTAERLVLELRDPLKRKNDNGEFHKLFVEKPMEPSGTKSDIVSGWNDAKDALVGLGYREQEVCSVLNRLTSGPSVPQRVEDLIRSALKQMSS